MAPRAGARARTPPNPVPDTIYYDEGKLAHSLGQPESACPYHRPERRVNWLAGWHESRRLAHAATLTPQQIAEHTTVVRRLKDWATEHLGT